MLSLEPRKAPKGKPRKRRDFALSCGCQSFDYWLVQRGTAIPVIGLGICDHGLLRWMQVPGQC